MITISRLYNNLCNWIEKLLYWFICLLLSSLIIVVFLQVVARYLLSNPWLWTVDIALFCLVWLTFMGAAIGVRHNSHFLIDLWPSHWSKIIKTLTCLAVLSTVFIASLYLLEGWNYATSNMNALSGMTDIPLFYFILSIPIGAGFMILFSIEWIMKEMAQLVKRRNEI